MKSTEIQTVERPLIDEKKLARAVGVRRRWLARWRQTYGTREEDWCLVGERVALTTDGARKACKAIGAPFSTAKALTEATFDKKNAAGMSVCVRFKPVNKRVVMCSALSDNRGVTVRVKSNINFRPGDEFEAHVEQDGTLSLCGDWPEKGW